MKKIKPSSLSKSQALRLYKDLVTIRKSEEKIIEVYPSDKIQSPVHLSIGQEAVAVGVCGALEKKDHIYSTYRSHAVYVAKGGDLNTMFAELYAKSTGCAQGRGGSMHLVAPDVGLMCSSAIVGSSIPVAAGDAWAAQSTKASRVVVVIFGDGAIDEGVFFETVNFAVLKKLPLLFILENNGYAIHSPVAQRHAQVDLFRVGEGLGLYGQRMNGDDVYKIHEKVSWARTQVLNKGPFLLELTTLRWKDHVGIGSDLDASYRGPQEKKEALSRDPLRIARNILLNDFHVKPKELDRLEDDVSKNIYRAVDFAEKSPSPSKNKILEQVYQ